MNNIASDIFKLLYEKYQETLSHEIVIEFPNEMREKRTEIGNKLKNNDYIEKFDSYGKRFFRCILTQKTINLFLKKWLSEEMFLWRKYWK